MCNQRDRPHCAQTRWRWTIQLKVGDDEFEKTTEAAIQSLLPIQAYSQKQLSSVSIRVDELLRFVTSPIQRQLEEIDRKRQEVAGRLRENYGTLQRHRDLSAEVERGDLRIRSLAEQAKSLRDGLAGISDDDRKVLDGKAGHDDLRSAQTGWLQHIESAQANLTSLVATLDSSLEELELPASTPANVATEATALLTTARNALSGLRSTISRLETEFYALTADNGGIAVPAELLSTELAEYDEAYRAVKERSSAHEVKLAELANLEEQQRKARELLQRQRAERDALGKPEAKHKEFRAELTAARKERTSALQAECEALSTSSDGMIRATLSTNRGFDTVQTKFKALIAGSKMRASKVDAFFEELTKESDPAVTWEVLLEELESLTLLEPGADVSSEQTPVLN